MKGIIFTEFLEMVEEKFGFDMVDDIISAAKDPNEGAYTSVNTYSHKQLVNLVVELHKKTQVPLGDLMKVYGRHLFSQLAINYPTLMKGVSDSFSMLTEIEVLIHTEVRKLYPDSNPPKFTSEKIDQNTLMLTYMSHRSMGPVAEGLILGCGDYFNEKLQVIQESSSEDGQKVVFIITKL